MGRALFAARVGALAFSCEMMSPCLGFAAGMVQLVVLYTMGMNLRSGLRLGRPAAKAPDRWTTVLARTKVPTVLLGVCLCTGRVCTCMYSSS